MSNKALADRFIAAVGVGDESAARSCFHADAEIWHNYDGATQSLDENMALMQKMKAKSSSREYQIHLVEDIPGGYVQRHTLHLTSLDGAQRVSTEALAIVYVEEGKIARIEEFLDPSNLIPLLAGD